MKLVTMKNGSLFSSEQPFRPDAEYDVIVAGLGTAGAICLITAARLGLRVFGVERLEAMGGTGTLGGIASYYFGSTGGLYTELNEKARALQETFYVSTEPIHCGAKAYVLEEEARKCGAAFAYHTIVTGVLMEGQTVKGLQIHSGGKFSCIGAKFVIDATGDAEICRLCGCGFRRGRSFDNQTQPYTNTCLYLDQAGRPAPMNRDAGYVDQTDPADYTRAVLHANTLAIHLKEHYPVDSVRFITVAPLLGVREGPVVQGKEILSFQACMKDQKTVPDPIFYAFSNIDIHAKDIQFEDDILIRWYIVCGLWGLLFSVPVPMGALIPQGFGGLLTAGRCLSVDHDIASCVRMKSDMEKSGEAAAQMAYLAIQNNCAAAEINYPDLAARLTASGCFDKANHVGTRLRTPDHQVVVCQFPQTLQEIKEALATKAPGMAIWSAYRMGPAAAAGLKEGLASPHEDLRKHTALALGLLGDRDACPVLRDMAVSLDSFIPLTTEKYVYTRATSAICLLGMLRDIEALEPLFHILETDGAFPADGFQPDELYASAAEVSVQYFLYSAKALLEIIQVLPAGSREAALARFRSLVLERNTPLTITLKGNPEARYDLAPKLKEYSKAAITQFKAPGQV